MWRQEVNSFKRANQNEAPQLYGRAAPGAATAPSIQFHIPRAVRSSSANPGPLHSYAALAHGAETLHSANVSSTAPSGILPTGGPSSAQHDRSAFSNVASQHHVVSDHQRGSALVSSRSSSVAAPSSVEVTSRCNYLEAVNTDLRRELDRARADCSRFQLENSRLKELLNSSSFQNDYLRLQLEKTQSRNVSMMHFDATPEGQSQAERLDSQNAALRAALRDKEQELASVQLKIVELQGRVKAFEEALLPKQQQPMSSSRQELEPHQGTSEGKSSSVAEEEALSELLSSVSFVAASVQSLHHVVCVKHAELPLRGSGLGCDVSRRDCLQRRLNGIVEGNPDSASEARARSFKMPASQILLSAQRLLLQCETALVKVATHCLATPQRLTQLIGVDDRGDESQVNYALPSFSQHQQIPPRDHSNVTLRSDKASGLGEEDGEVETAGPRQMTFTPHPTPSTSHQQHHQKKKHPIVDSSTAISVPTAAPVRQHPPASEYFSARGRSDEPKPAAKLASPPRAAAETQGPQQDAPGQAGKAPSSKSALPMRSSAPSDAKPSWISPSSLTASKNRSNDDCEVQ